MSTSTEIEVMTTTFQEKASPYIQLGIPVIPLVPRGKLPPSSMKEWQTKATTAHSVIASWNEENPEYNIGLVAKAELEGFCFLEFDVKGAMKDISAECGQAVPETRTHRSGRGFGHYIKQTEKSILLGNRSANLSTKDEAGTYLEWFSFRAHNKFLVGAGSIHPNGNVYAVLKDIEPIDIPDWLVAFIDKNTTPIQVYSTQEIHPVCDDFDFDHWCDHYSEIFTIPNAHCEGWMTTDVCPWAGYGHESSIHTGFYFDGESIGFHCFAQGCSGHGKGIGETIKMMNEKVGVYPELVWPNDEERYDAIMSVEDLEVESHSQPQREAPRELTEADFDGFTSTTLVDAPQTAQEELTTEVKVAVAPAEHEDPLKFPDDAMYGKLGQMAHDMKMPRGLAYPALLAAYSALPVHHEMCGTRINMYVCNIAVIGGGKDTAYKRAVRLLNMQVGVDYEVSAPCSDRGLGTLFGDAPAKKKGEPRIPGPKRMLLVSEEMEEVLKKGGISQSTMFQTFQTLWDGNRKVFPDKHGKITVDCRLSWLAGLPVSEKKPEIFAELFGESSTHGLLSRLFFGYSGTKWNYREWDVPTQKVGTVTEITLSEDEGFDQIVEEKWKAPTLVKGLNPEAQALYDRWESKDISGRDKFYLMKVALLTSSANDEEYVSLACMEAAVRIMAWQRRLHEVFKPGVAKATVDAQFTERALNTLSRYRGKLKIVDGKGYIPWRRVSHDNKWDETFGSTVVGRCMGQLIKNGRLRALQVVETNENGKEKVKADDRYIQVVTYKGGEKSGDGEIPSTKTQSEDGLNG